MSLREAAQQALEAMDCPGKAKTADEQAAITALRAALAEPRPIQECYGDCPTNPQTCPNPCKFEGRPKPVQEPVAWMIYTEGGTSAYVTDNPNDLVGAYRALALYTTPPQRKPLTEEEILSVLRLAPPEPSLWPHLKDEAVVGDVQKAVLAIARAIERAHGIGGSDE